MKEKPSKDWSLENIQNELNSLLEVVKSKNELNKGDKFTTDKDISIPGQATIGKGITIEIIDIKKPKENGQTTVIYYIISGEDENILEMSDGIFITNFCTELFIETNHVEKKIKNLREQEKRLKASFKKNKETDDTIEGVKEQVNFLVGLTKLLKKKHKEFLEKLEKLSKKKKKNK